MAGSENGFCVWDLTTNTNHFYMQQDVLGVRFTPDGKSIAVGTRQNSAQIWDTDPPGRNPSMILEGHKGWVFSAAFNTDGSKIITASADNTARIWPVAHDGKQLIVKGQVEVLQHPDRVLDAAFSPDGSRVATACADGRLRVWTTDSPPRFLKDFVHIGEINSVAFSANGKLILTASKDNTAHLWSLETGELYLDMPHVPLEVRSAAFGPKDSSVFTGGEDGFVRIWRTSIHDLVTYMSDASTACLTVRERIRLLGESESEARSVYRKCEADHHRTIASK